MAEIEKEENGQDLVFIQRIKKLMKAKQWGMADLASHTGMSMALTYRYMSNEYKNPTLKNLMKFAKGLHVPVSYLLGEEVSFTPADAVANGFTSIFRWQLSRNGDRGSSLGNVMFSNNLLSKLKVNVDDLDVIVMPDNSMKPLLNKGDDLLCYALPETDPWVEVENGLVYIFFYKNIMYVARLKRNMDDSISVWQDSAPNQINDFAMSDLNLKYRVLYRNGYVE